MKTIGTILAAWLVLSAAALAQMEMPKPGPEHKKLDMFAGTWTLDGDMKPGAMGPGGKVTENEKCEWMEGGFFLVCHTDLKSAMGNGTSVSIMGYSTDDKSYTYREFNSWGEFVDSKGSAGWRHVDLDQRRENGGHDDQGALHHESDFVDVVQLHVRNVPGWNEVDDGDGREGDQGKVMGRFWLLARGFCQRASLRAKS